MGQFNLNSQPPVMVSKLVAAFTVLPACVLWAALPVHHPAPYAPSPAPYAPSPAPSYGYCDPKALPKCVEGSDLPYCVEDPEYPAYDIANQSANDLVQDIVKSRRRASTTNTTQGIARD